MHQKQLYQEEKNNFKNFNKLINEYRTVKKENRDVFSQNPYVFLENAINKLDLKHNIATINEVESNDADNNKIIKLKFEGAPIEKIFNFIVFLEKYNNLYVQNFSFERITKTSDNADVLIHIYFYTKQ